MCFCGVLDSEWSEEFIVYFKFCEYFYFRQLSTIYFNFWFFLSPCMFTILCRKNARIFDIMNIFLLANWI